MKSRIILSGRSRTVYFRRACAASKCSRELFAMSRGLTQKTKSRRPRRGSVKCCSNRWTYPIVWTCQVQISIASCNSLVMFSSTLPQTRRASLSPAGAGRRAAGWEDARWLTPLVICRPRSEMWEAVVHSSATRARGIDCRRIDMSLGVVGLVRGVRAPVSGCSGLLRP
jgi:hypothetical protein